MRVLLIEDHARLAALVRQGLEAADLAVDGFATAEEALEALDFTTYDAVILDLGLPDQDGLAVLRSLRGRGDSTPVLILTSRIQVSDRVKGLNAGADDYLTKPFAMEELVARVHALLRRPNQALGMTLAAGNITFDTVARETRVEGQIVSLSRREMGVLEQLMRRSGRVVPKKLIEDTLYGLNEEISSNAVEVMVHRLRHKLTDAGARVAIHTVRGVGYLLSDEAT